MRLSSLPLIAACLLSSPALSDGRSIIVLDASGSMWGQIDGRTKLEIAREALTQVLAGIAPETEIGLMAYGHRTKGDCADIELVVPPAAGTATAITDAANAMKFLGKTPLSDAVRKAAEDLRYTEEKANVILITDGIETCNADPCALGAELEQSGVDFTAHVVGFGLTEDEGRAVACLAENTGGKYIQAADADALVDALKTAVAVPEPAPEPVQLAENTDPVLRLVAGGKEVTGDLLGAAYFEFLTPGADGQPGATVETIYSDGKALIPAGDYIMRTTLHNAVVDQPVTLSGTELNLPEAVLDAGVLSLRILAEEGGEPAAEANWEMRGAGGIHDTGYAQTYRVFPSGEYELALTLGEMSAKEAVVITAGEVLEKTIVLGVGKPVFTAYYAEGVPVEGDQTFDIYEAAVGLDGNRKSVRTDYGAGAAPSLPPGDYVVVASVQSASAELAFTVKPGQRIDVPVILNAGLAAISAPNATALDIFGAKAGLDGKRPSVRSDYGDSFLLTLPAGDYVGVAEVDAVKAEAPFTVKAAERTELTITLVLGMAAISATDANEIDIFAAQAGLDGERPRVRSDYGDKVEKMLPPGDYIAVARAGKAEAEAPFSIKDGERTELSITIPRGVIAVSAPGAKEIVIYHAKVGLDGNRDYISSEYRDVSDPVLPPGDYVAAADFGDGVMVETPVTLGDGQRLEVTLTKP